MFAVLNILVPRFERSGRSLCTLRELKSFYLTFFFNLEDSKLKPRTFKLIDSISYGLALIDRKILSFLQRFWVFYLFIPPGYCTFAFFLHCSCQLSKSRKTAHTVMCIITWVAVSSNLNMNLSCGYSYTYGKGNSNNLFNGQSWEPRSVPKGHVSTRARKNPVFHL